MVKNEKIDGKHNIIVHPGQWQYGEKKMFNVIGVIIIILNSIMSCFFAIAAWDAGTHDGKMRFKSRRAGYLCAILVGTFWMLSFTYLFNTKRGKKK